MADEQQLLRLIASNEQGILAAVTRSGYPHLTNILYVWDEAKQTARVSTTADRVKGRILRHDTHTALHVAGDHFWSFAVAECDATLSEVASSPGDAACQELLRVHSQVVQEVEDESAFFDQMIEAKRLVVRLKVRRVYGVLLDTPPGA